jgi:hypothetical protein
MQRNKFTIGSVYREEKLNRMHSEWLHNERRVKNKEVNYKKGRQLEAGKLMAGISSIRSFIQNNEQYHENN